MEQSVKLSQVSQTATSSERRRHVYDYYLDTKYRQCFPKERIANLVQYVENVIHKQKIFKINGDGKSIRRSLYRRGWLEKADEMTLDTQALMTARPSMNSLFNGLPQKKDTETKDEYSAVCEKLIIARMLKYRRANFFWNLKRGDEAENLSNIHPMVLVNRFAQSKFACKAGLCAMLSEMQWYCEPGIAHTKFPRCYNTTIPDQHAAFIEDYRRTACMSLLKYFLSLIHKNGLHTLTGPYGIIKPAIIEFAIARCEEYSDFSTNQDLDRKDRVTKKDVWETFLQQYHLFVYMKNKFLARREDELRELKDKAEAALERIRPNWEQYDLDGMMNIWIIKPWNKCMGRGIQLLNKFQEIFPLLLPSPRNKYRYVIQKYIENPLLIFETKFDIRQWFLVTSVHPLTIWIYKECYIRFSSQKFDLNNFHESIHLTNNAVQHKYKNAEDRDPMLPENNMWDFKTFQTYLYKMGTTNKWYQLSYPGMKEAIVGAMLASQDYMSRRPNSFQLYGADFMLGADYTPWLLEINSSPQMAPTTKVTAEMCPQCLEDIIKVVIDRREFPKANTGNFELVYKQRCATSNGPVVAGLTLHGRSIRRPKKPPLVCAQIDPVVCCEPHSCPPDHTQCDSPEPSQPVLYSGNGGARNVDKRVINLQKTRAMPEFPMLIPTINRSTMRLVKKALMFTSRSCGSKEFILGARKNAWKWKSKVRSKYLNGVNFKQANKNNIKQQSAELAAARKAQKGTKSIKTHVIYNKPYMTTSSETSWKSKKKRHIPEVQVIVKKPVTVERPKLNVSTVVVT